MGRVHELQSSKTVEGYLTRYLGGVVAININHMLLVINARKQPQMIISC